MADHPEDPRDNEPYGEPPEKPYEAPRKVTLSGQPADPNYKGGAPQDVDPVTGMHKDYWVLSDEERAKGFVEPVRSSYKHVGRPGPKYELRDLTAEEMALYDDAAYVKYETFPPEEAPKRGRLWTSTELNSINNGCGSVTKMGPKLAETYARLPEFYGSTFCCQCHDHFPVGDQGEFVWLDEPSQRVGTRRK